uniref:BEN domain-containing protein n=1 Tax=Amblyomma triste TaxID=251400 RepID=A0A023G912_AMBTT
MFVYVEFESNLKTAVVEHTQVRHVDSKKGPFNPLDADDFDAAESYRVHTYYNGDNCEFLNAKIIRITETLEEMVAFKSKRPKRCFIQEVNPQRPKQKGPHASCTSAQRLERGHAKRAQRQLLIERALHDYEAELTPENSLKTLENRLKAVEEQLSQAEPGSRRQSSQSAAESDDSVPRSDYAVLQKKYEALQRDIEELQTRNSELERSLKSKISQDEESRPTDSAKSEDFEISIPLQAIAVEQNGPPTEPEDSAAPDTQAEGAAECVDVSTFYGETKESSADVTGNDVSMDPVEASEPAVDESYVMPDLDETFTDCKPDSMGLSYSGREVDGEPEVGTVRKDGKVYGGCGYWFTKGQWSKMFSAKSDANFCGRAASLFWTESELAERCVTGRLSNASISRGETIPRPPLSPDKLSALKDLFRVYVGKDPLMSRRMKNVRPHLSTYLCTVRKRRKSSSQQLKHDI